MIGIIWSAMCILFLAFGGRLAYVYATQGKQAVGDELDAAMDKVWHIDNVHKGEM